MTMRVTSASYFTRLSADLGNSLGRVQSLQNQVSSGSRINKLSDDAVGAGAALRLRSDEAAWSAYQRAADDATSVLGTTDSALQTMSTVLRRVKELAVSSVNGAQGPAERSAIADEIAGIRDQVRDLGNTRHLGRAVFGGFRANAVTQDATTKAWSYVGDDGQVQRQIGPTVTVPVNLDGRQVLGFDQPAGQDLYSVLDRLEQTVRAGDGAGSQAAQAQLQTRTDAVSIALGKIGAMQNRVESASDLGHATVDRLTEQRSKIEDTDLAETILRLNQATSGYQAALGATARANLPTLADFLR